MVMRVAVVAESFLPNINGVTNSVLRVLEHLSSRGDDAIVIAPGARPGEEEVIAYAGYEIVRLPAMMVPLINSLPIGVPMPLLTHTLKAFKPDVIHLASPFVIGAAGAFAARQMNVPSVAVFQTDIAGFAERYHLKALANASWEWGRIVYNASSRTLAPSTPTINELKAHGFERVYRWGRGVDSVRFNPHQRDETLRRQWDPSGKKTIIGFVGRLAAEKGVHRLQALANRTDIQLIVTGDGPERATLEKLLPGAVFTGALTGDPLARVYASLDIFVHTGEYETFCQAVQEAQASGVPVIAPKAGGPIDLVTEGKDGYLLDVPTFEQDLSGVVDLIVSDHAHLAANARQRTEGRTWEAICGQLRGHYAAVIDEHSPAGPEPLRRQWLPLFNR